MSHPLDQAHRRADAVSAYTMQKFGKLPAQLAPETLQQAYADVDAALAVIDVIRAHDTRDAVNLLGPGIASIAQYETVMAGEGR